MPPGPYKKMEACPSGAGLKGDLHAMSTLVLAEIFLPTIGGSVNWLINSYSRYPLGEVVVVAPKYENKEWTDESLPFPVIRMDMDFPEWDPTAPRIFYSYLKSFQKLLKVCQTHHVDQVHCAKVLPEGILARCLQVYLGLPYFIYAHGEEIPIGQTSRILSWFMPRVYNNAAGIIANSRNTKSLLEGIGVWPEIIRIIHPGVDTHELRKGEAKAALIRSRFGLGSSLVLLIVGRLQRRKGHDMLIRAMPIIRSQFPQTKCLIVGTGQEETYLKQIVQECREQENVIFVGRVSDVELGSYYAACDIFVMPNRQIAEDIEGFGMVFLEAAALGKPVIGGTSGGTDDAIVDGVTGLRVDGSRPEAIAKAVISLLGDPEKVKVMGECGRHRVDQEFTWNKVVEETRKLTVSFKQPSGRGSHVL